MTLRELDDNSYKANYEEKIAQFQNNFITRLWKNMDFFNKHRDDYYEINRSLCDAIRKNIEVVSVQKFLSYGTQAYDFERIKEYTKHQMASMLAEAILQSNHISIKESQDLQGNTILRIELPFIKLESSES